MAFKVPAASAFTPEHTGRQLTVPTVAPGTMVRGKRNLGYVPKPQPYGQVFPKRVN